MIKIYSHMFLRSKNLFDVQAEFERNGTTFEVHSAGEGLVGRELIGGKETDHVPESQTLLNGLQ